MADVIVTLSLTRKTGILAAAVSSLARNGLEFKSHRFVDADDSDVLHVELMADGSVEDTNTLTEVLVRIRGVDTVADIRVDGRSLLHDLPAEEEPEVDIAPAPEPELSVPLDTVPAPAVPEPVPEPESAHEQFSEPEPELELEPEPEPEPETEESPASTGEPLSESAEGVDSGGSRSGRRDSSDKNPMRRSMMRRRRRFT